MKKNRICIHSEETAVKKRETLAKEENKPANGNQNRIPESICCHKIVLLLPYYHEKKKTRFTFRILFFLLCAV